MALKTDSEHSRRGEGDVIGRARGARLRSASIAHRVAQGTPCRDLRETLAVYFERRMARILLLGIISGFPWVLNRQQPDPLAHGRRAQPQHHRLGRPDLRCLRVQLPLGPADRPRPAAVALAAARAAARLDPRPAGGGTGVPRAVERAGPLRKSGGPSSPLVLPSPWASATQDIAIDALRIEQMEKTEGEAMAAGAGGRSGRLVERIQARRHRRLGDGGRLPDRRRRKLLGRRRFSCWASWSCSATSASCSCARRQRRRAWPPRPRTRSGSPRAWRVSGPIGRIAAWLGGHGLQPAHALLREERRSRSPSRCWGFRLPVQDRRSLPGADVAGLLYRDRLHQVGHRALFQGPRLDRHRGVHAAGRPSRGPHRPHPGHVRIRDRHGADQSHVRAAGLVREVGGAVRCGGW